MNATHAPVEPATQRAPRRAFCGCVLLLSDGRESRRMPESLFEQVLQDHGLVTRRLHAGPADALRRALESTVPDGWRLGLLGCGAAAAVALEVAAAQPARVAAVVACSSRPARGDGQLAQVHAATLFIVGSLDLEALQCSRDAARAMRCTTRLEQLPGSGPRLCEPGAPLAAAHLAAHWFRQHLARR